MKDFQNIKKVTVLLLLLLLQSNITKACNKNPFCNNYKEYDFFCDLCSCSTSSGSLGFGTLSNKNFIGIRYVYQNFESKNGIFDNSPITKEHFNTYQLWAQIPLSENFFVSANLPYQNLKRIGIDGNETIKGLGDISIVGWYKLIFYKKQKDQPILADKEASGHSLKFGLGVKLPTGKFEEELSDNINPGFQVGTGSFDGVFSLGYSYRKSKYGVNTLLSYYLKGENKNQYQFGNQFSYNANFYGVFSTKKMGIMPFIGVSGDVYNQITQYNETINDTNGSVLSASLGSELAVDKFVFGTSYSVPLRQHLFGDNVRSKQQLSVYINYAL